MLRAGFVLTAIIAAAPAASAAPWVVFDKAGDTYSPATIAVLSDWEGTRSVVNDAPAGGITLTADATFIEDTDDYVSGAGVGVLPLMASSPGGQPECNAKANYSPMPIIAKNPRKGQRPTRNGLWVKKKWRATGCLGDGTGFTWPVANGETTWTVSKYRRVYRKQLSRRIWDYQFDDYINICINGGYDLRASGGRLYCTVVTRTGLDRTTYRLTQRTKIAKRYPAYINP